MIYQREDDVGHPERGRNVIIVDWKFLNEMYTTAFGGRMCAPPFHALPDCNLYHYYIQLNGYRYMLERRTKLRVTDTLIVDFGAANPSYRIYEVPDLQREFADAVAVRRLMHLRRNMGERKRLVNEADFLAARIEKDRTHDDADAWSKRLKRTTGALLDVDRRLAPLVAELADARNAELRRRMGVADQAEITDFFKPK
jgi:hypothetical protein